MLTYPDLLKRNEIEQIRLSLLTYEERGEYDGSLLSAMECLLDAEYELDTECHKYMYYLDFDAEDAHWQATYHDTKKY